VCVAPQLLLRRSGWNLQTSAEKELVRQIKVRRAAPGCQRRGQLMCPHRASQEEKCYVAFNPKREEEHPPQPESFRLPDGAVLKVRG
jgi:hypothetical protein